MPIKIKQPEIQKVPKLRFPEFSGKWEEKKLGSFLDYEQPINYIVKNTEYSNKYKTPVLTAGKTFILGHTSEKNGIFKANKLPVIIFDDFTTAKKFVDFIFKVKSSAMKILKNRDKNLSDIRFIYSAMQRIRFGLGEEHKRFWISEYSKIKIYFPSLPEQQKIANFLGSVDKWIENLREQKENLETYKKEMMQKIFPAKGGQVPEIRFPEFSDKWGEKKLGDICEYKNGGSFEKFITKKGRYNLITLNSVKINGELKIQHKKVRTADWFLKKDDLVMVLSDVAHGDFLGLVDIIPRDSKYVLNQRMGMLRKVDNNINLVFLRKFINYNQKYFKRHGQGSSQQNLSKGDIIKFKISFPPLLEQQKIADFLTAIDNLIKSKQQQITQAESWKKGLMQRLFV